MAANEIKIVIGGDATPLIAANQQSEASVNALQKTIVAASAKIDTATDAIRHSFDEVAAGAAAMERIAASINEVAAAATKAGPKFDSLGGRLPLEDFNKFRYIVDQLKKDIASGTKIKFDIPKPPHIPPIPDPFKEIPKGANQATNALTNLGRIVQDAPFGFLGISNNINPLLESFQRLRAETGSNKAALSALGSSLLGAGGLGIAVSAASSLLVLFGDKLFKASKEAEDLKKRQKDLNEAINGAFESTAKEATQAGVLVAVLRSETETRARKLAAIKELQGISPEIFKNLKLEGDAVVGLDTSYKQFLANLKNVVAVRIQQAKLEQLIEQQLKKQGANLVGKDAIGTLQSTKEQLQQLKDLQKGGGIVDPNQIKLLESVITKTEGEIGSLNTQIEDILKNIESISKGVKISADGKKEEDALKKRIDALKELQSLTGLDLKQRIELSQLEVQLTQRDAIKLALKPNEVKEKIQAQISQIFPTEFSNFFVRTKFKVDPEFSVVKPVSNLGVGLAGTNKFSTDIAEAVGIGDTISIPAPKFIFLNLKDKQTQALADLNKAIQEIGTKIQTDALVALGEGIGNAITGKGDLFTSLFTVLADGLQQLGKALIAYGVALLGFKTALKSLNPVTALAAGTLAVAAGAALKASLPKFATGGIATGPTLGIFGEAGKEAIIPLDKLPEMLGRINVNNQNDVALAPTFRVSLTDLELGLERVRSRRRRLG